MIRYRDGYRAIRHAFLHYDVAPASSNLHEAMSSEDRANFFA
jgi:hypothetical protein